VYLDKVKLIKLFIENLVYAFFFKRWVCFEGWFFNVDYKAKERQ
jgi:hypothetical protein